MKSKKLRVFNEHLQNQTQKLEEEIFERKKAEAAILKLNRELRAISICNQAIVHSTSEQDFYRCLPHHVSRGRVPNGLVRHKGI